MESIRVEVTGRKPRATASQQAVVEEEEPLPDDLSSDLLWGAAAIAKFLFGTPKRRRKVYHLYSTGQLPLSKVGAELVGSKLTLREHLKGQALSRRMKEEGATGTTAP
jgi:hypothetical protein